MPGRRPPLSFGNLESNVKAVPRCLEQPALQTRGPAIGTIPELACSSQRFLCQAFPVLTPGLGDPSRPLQRYSKVLRSCLLQGDLGDLRTIPSWTCARWADWAVLQKPFETGALATLSHAQMFTVGPRGFSAASALHRFAKLRRSFVKSAAILSHLASRGHRVYKAQAAMSHSDIV